MTLSRLKTVKEEALLYTCELQALTTLQPMQPQRELELKHAPTSYSAGINQSVRPSGY